MATFSSVTKKHVLAAMAEHDERGAEDFGAAYGFPADSGTTVVHEGRSYDAAAVLGVAHRHATGRLPNPEEVANSWEPALGILRKRGFEVREPARAVRAVAAAPVARAARASRAAGTSSNPRRTPTEERPRAICPTCFTALPATGRCDTCA